MKINEVEKKLKIDEYFRESLDECYIVDINYLIKNNIHIKKLNEKFKFQYRFDQLNEILPILIDIDIESRDKEISNKQFITSMALSKTGQFTREWIKNPRYEISNINNFISYNIKNYSKYNLGNFGYDNLNLTPINKVEKNIKVTIDKLFLTINKTDKRGFSIFNFKSFLYAQYKNSLINEIIKKLNINNNKIIYSSIFYLSEFLKSKFKFPQDYKFLIDELRNYDFLIIDEISFLKTSNWFLNVLLTNILLYRIEYNKKTIFICELSKEDFNLLVKKSLSLSDRHKESFEFLSKEMNDKKYEEFLELFNNLFDYIEINKKS